MSTKLTNNHQALHIAVAGILSLGTVLATTNAQAVPKQPTHWEKCAGIAKQGKNDCGALDGSHKCAGQAKSDLLDHEWVYVPKGTCEKIVGGMVKKVKPAKS